MNGSEKVFLLGENSQNKPLLVAKAVKAENIIGVKIGNAEYDLTPDIQSAISSQVYNINNLNDDDDILTFNDNL